MVATGKTFSISKFPDAVLLIDPLWLFVKEIKEKVATLIILSIDK